MKLMIDAHLPRRLCFCFKNHDVIHTSDLPKGNLTSDQWINEFSIKEKAAVITKDAIRSILTPLVRIIIPCIYDIT